MRFIRLCVRAVTRRASRRRSSSRDEVPTMISKSPGSTRHVISTSVKAKAPGPSSISTAAVSPGARETRWKPFISFTGRVTELTRSRTYTCTTSAPARPPGLATVAKTRVDPPGPPLARPEPPGLQPRARHREGGVAEPEAEGEERRRVVPQVAAAGGWLVVVEGGKVPHRAGDGDGELPARCRVAEEELGHGAPGLLPRVPALQDRRDALGHAVDRERAPVE